ncbi:DUF1127 domain-containing protein [Notoacmeibacter marinus]|uniref:DUF1127 domain-containing protein n=1 Tax=Notoacmeibacter marinus TaxID=1876515 RepID=UPI000DF48898|nr:DUF1127 domain-containing protein [Notoacmeibacter marinus]
MAIDTITRNCADRCLPQVSVRGNGFDLRWLTPYAVFATVLTFLAKRRSRTALARLGDDELTDIGVTRDQALREAERVLWRGDWYT